MAWAGDDTALHYVAHTGHLDVVGILIEAGSDVHAFEGNGDTPLHTAAREGHAVRRGTARRPFVDIGELIWHMTRIQII